MCLFDCFAVISRFNFSTFSLDSGQLLVDYGNKFHHDTLYVIDNFVSRNLHQDLEVQDGCHELQKFTFCRRPYMFAVGVKEDGVITYQVLYAKSTTTYNRDFTGFLLGDLLYRLKDGHFQQKALDITPKYE